MEIGLQAEILGLAAMVVVFALFAAIELISPARPSVRGRRWLTNLAMFAIDTLAVRLLVPLLMVGSAGFAAERGWGLLNVTALPGWLEFMLAIIALDLSLYFQHWATHRVPLLWRLHKVHHSDPTFDVTTAARFHPVEMIASMGWKMAVVVAFGLPVTAVFAFVVVFNLATLFTHANFALPNWLERPVRTMFVTPDMHRIHHSSIRCETDSNYGTLFSTWDRLFSTYTSQAKEGPEGIKIGLEEFQDDRPHRLGWSLLLPFRK